MTSGDDTLALSDLIARLQADESATVCSAAAQLGKRGASAAEAILDLARAWSCGSEETTAPVEDALRKIGSKAQPWLLAAMEDKDFPVELILRLHDASLFDDPYAALLCALRKALRGESLHTDYPDSSTPLSDCADAILIYADERAVPVLVQALNRLDYADIRNCDSVLREFCSIISALEECGPAAAPALPYLMNLLACEINDVRAGKWLYFEGPFTGLSAPSSNIGNLLVRIGRDAERAIPQLLELYGLVNDFQKCGDDWDRAIGEYQGFACGIIADTVRGIGCVPALNAICNFRKVETHSYSFEQFVKVFDGHHEDGCAEILRGVASLEVPSRDAALRWISCFIEPEIITTACDNEDETVRTMARLVSAKGRWCDGHDAAADEQSNVARPTDSCDPSSAQAETEEMQGDIPDRQNAPSSELPPNLDKQDWRRIWARMHFVTSEANRKETSEVDDQPIRRDQGDG